MTWEGPCLGELLDGIWETCGCGCEDCLDYRDDLRQELEENGWDE